MSTEDNHSDDNDDNNDNDNDNDNFLSLEELGEFEHIDDPHLDQKLNHLNSDQDSKEVETEVQEKDEQQEGFAEESQDEGFEEESQDEGFEEESQDEEFEENIEEDIEEEAQEQLEEENWGQSNENKFEQEPIENESSTEVIFSDVVQFSDNYNSAQIKGEANPPFSIVLSKIKYIEDCDNIMGILKEHGIVDQKNEDLFRQGLDKGTLLIPRISEYAAIFLAHKFRNVDLSLKMGLSLEIHPPQKAYKEDKGLVSKISLTQNTAEEIYLENRIENIEREILISTTSQIENYDVIKYLDILSAHSFLSSKELERWQYQKENDEISQEELNSENPQLSYSKLISDLKNNAYKIKADAVIGIQFSLSHMLQDQEKFKLTATGTAVILKKK